MIECWRRKVHLTPCHGCEMPLLDTPGIGQLGNFDCGRASALINLTYQSVDPAIAATMVGRLRVSTSDGVDPSELSTWGRAENWHVNEGWMSVSTLKHHADELRPVILLVTMHGNGHWIVSRGVSRGRIHFQDPNASRDSMKISEFVSIWHDRNRYGAQFEQWGFVMTPKTQKPGG